MTEGWRHDSLCPKCGTFHEGECPAELREPPTEDSWICASCRRPLDDYTVYEDNILVHHEWIHPPDITDHNPVPVRFSEIPGQEIRTKCDFCGDLGTDWVYPCKNFDVMESHGPEAPGWGSVGEWAACEQCHRWISRGYWDRILEKAVKNYPTLQRSIARPAVRKLHSQFRRHRIGDPYPANEKRK